MSSSHESLHPTQFRVNDAWMVFRLNDLPICTEAEGDFNCFALMDAASRFILSHAFTPIQEEEPSLNAVQKMLEEGATHTQQLPRSLFLPEGQFTSILPAEAQRQGIAVLRVPEDELHVFIDEARELFREHFGGGRLQ